MSVAARSSLRRARAGVAVLLTALVVVLAACAAPSSAGSSSPSSGPSDSTTDNTTDSTTDSTTVGATAGSALTPLPFPTPGPVRASGGCPADATGLPFSGTSASPEAVDRVGPLAVPRGPVGALLCRYGSTVVGTAARLTATRGVDAASAAGLVALADAAPERATDQLGHVSCPYAGNGAVLLRFSYPDGSTADLVVRLTGCQQATSAHGTTTHRSALVAAVRRLI